MPTITQLNQTKKNKHDFFLHIDNEFYSIISQDCIRDNGWDIGVIITEDELEKGVQNDRCSYAYKKSLDYLARSAHTEQEVREYLAKKGFAGYAVSFAINKLNEYGYVNDNNYAKDYVSSGASQALGKYVIQRKMRSKGLKDDIIEDAMSEYSTENEENIALQFAIKQMKKIASLPKREAAGKLSAALARRGFSWDIIKDTVRKVIDDIEYEE